MPQCQAFGCSNKRGGSVDENGEKIHFFPIPKPDKSKENFELCKKWLHAIGPTKFEIKTYKYHRDRVVCHKHFSPDCFEEDLRARLTGSKPRKLLKYGSVPTIFVYREPEAKLKRTGLRLPAKKRQQMIESLVPEKRPKTETKVKKAPIELVQIREGDFPVGASLVVADTVVQRYTCIVKDVGTQVDLPTASKSCQTVAENSEVPQDCDYFGYSPKSHRRDDNKLKPKNTLSIKLEPEDAFTSEEKLCETIISPENVDHNHHTVEENEILIKMEGESDPSFETEENGGVTWQVTVHEEEDKTLTDKTEGEIYVIANTDQEYEGAIC